jgi:altronate dehydratase small subunit
VPRAIIIDAADNVATALADLGAGDTVEAALDERKVPVLPVEDIPLGHKFAVRPIGLHREVIKYGEVIGRATEYIGAGSHVHVHNVESLRGRGDWESEEDGPETGDA